MKTTNELTAKFYTRTNDTGVQYLRIVVPKELRTFVSKAAMWRSLSTKVMKEAQPKALAIALATQRLLREVSDEHVEAAVVKMNIDIGIKKVAEALEKVPQDAVEEMLPPLRKALGMKEVELAEKPEKKTTKKGVKAATGNANTGKS